MGYCSSLEVWKNLGKNAYTKIRDEVVGTGNGSTSLWDLDHDNVISSSLTLYTNSTSVATSSYSLNLDDGRITGLTLSAAVTLSADYDYGDLPDSLIQQMISSSDQLIHLQTGRNFGNNTGTTEYLSVGEDQNVFFLKNYPVITLTSIEVNTVDAVDPPAWELLTEGLGNDYLANSDDLAIGRVRFIDNFPLQGYDQIKATYDYGYTSTPPLVNELSVLLTLRNMANSSVYKSIFKGQDNFTPVKLTEIEARIEELKRILKKQSVELI